MYTNSTVSLLALVIAALVAAGLAPAAPGLRLVDLPDDTLKDHGRAVPITGGIALFAAVHTSLLVAGDFDPGLFVVTMGLLALGLYDDLAGLSPVTRLAGAIAAGVVLSLWADVPAGLLAAAVTVVAVVGGVNAVNLLDGADGVAGAAATLSALGLGLLAWSRSGDPVTSLIVAGAAAGFLIVNWPPARVFLGDGGAYVTGALLAYLALTSAGLNVSLDGDSLAEILVAGAMFGVFVVDLGVTLIRRVLNGVPMFGGDRSHVYDQLATRGWAPWVVAATVAFIQAVIVGVVLGLDLSLSPWTAAVSAFGVLALFVGLLGLLGFIRREETTAPAPNSG